MLASTTCSVTDVHTPGVNAEFMGKARAIRARVEAEDITHDKTINALLEPCNDRLRRYPKRPLRQHMLTQAITGWLGIEGEFRLSADGRLDRKTASIVERRVIAGKLRRSEWVGDETDIGVIELTLTIDRNRARLTTHCFACFSLHAVARFLQRHPEPSTESLLAALNVAADAAVKTTPIVGAVYSVRVDQHGGWRGRGILLTSADGRASPTLSIRTWLESS